MFMSMLYLVSDCTHTHTVHTHIKGFKENQKDHQNIININPQYKNLDKRLYFKIYIRNSF